MGRRRTCSCPADTTVQGSEPKHTALTPSSCTPVVRVVSTLGALCGLARIAAPARWASGPASFDAFLPMALALREAAVPITSTDRRMHAPTPSHHKSWERHPAAGGHVASSTEGALAAGKPLAHHGWGIPDGKVTRLMLVPALGRALQRAAAAHAPPVPRRAAAFQE